ncbi:MAG TPA: hypothetical protein VN086_02735 [Candidatus Paceibacterota bacterium]|nr:hypothetical protein [Candidatus Paceibacterota bacterium]
MEKSLKDLLNRLPIPGLKESNDRHTIAEILTKELSIPIKAKQIDLKDQILTVSVPPVIKSALQIRAEKIKAALSKEGIIANSVR